MASAVTVLLLGCSLARHSWVLGGQYPKPTIWVSPSRVVALGGSVTIRCAGRYPGREFFLRKAGHPNPQVRSVPDGTVAEFPIPSVGREDGGSYTCEYHSIAEQNRWSHPSDPVEIIVAEGTDPAGPQKTDLTPTEPTGEGGSYQSAAPVLIRTIIAGVSAAAAGLLLLLAFLCYRRTRGNASIDEGKELQTLEPDPGTYAELDRQTLQPSVYAEINVSQGPPQ